MDKQRGQAHPFELNTEKTIQCDNFCPFFEESEGNYFIFFPPGSEELCHGYKQSFGTTGLQKI